MHLFWKFVSVLACFSLTSCAAAQTLPVAEGKQKQTESGTAQPFVIAANPLAAEAGLNVLKRGGSAVDAAVAAQAMLSLVEPQSSGMGGGAPRNSR